MWYTFEQATDIARRRKYDVLRVKMARFVAFEQTPIQRAAAIQRATVKRDVRHARNLARSFRGSMHDFGGTQAAVYWPIQVVEVSS